jgi:predicted small secreted protein
VIKTVVFKQAIKKRGQFVAKSKNTRFAKLFHIALLCALIGTASAAQAYTGSELEGRAKIKMAQARKIALRAHHGKITDEELEVEKGGSGLRYSFDIRSRHKVYEVGVDAKTGKVLENAPEGKKPD